MESSAKRGHVMVLAFPEQGHIQPCMHISEILASRGFSITFPLSHVSHRMLTAAAARHSAGVRLERLPRRHGEGDHVEKQGGLKDNIAEMEAMEAGVEKLLERLVVEAKQPVKFILVDMFVIWAHRLAAKYNIPLIILFTSNALSCSIVYHARSLESEGILPFREEDGSWRYTKPVDIPGRKAVLPKDFPMPLTFWKTHFLYRFSLSIKENFDNCSGIVLNTFEDLEPSHIASLRTLDPRIFAVGHFPLLSDSNNYKINYWKEQEECLSWLYNHPPATVLYVAFGSNHSQSVQQFLELALGLQASGQPFLWAVRPNSIEGCVESSFTKLLPEGFAKDGRGMLISWVPQIAVLSHPSVGGFMTHVGWNSTIESVSVGGVPLICWPHWGEQRLNCRICVDDLKIGLEIHNEEEEGGVVGRGEVERVVRVLMQSEEGKKLKENALHLKNLASKAVGDHGSSHKDMEDLVCMLASGGTTTHHSS